MTAVESRSIDLLDGYLYAGDPYPTYAWLRANAPVYWDEINGLWGISRYRDVMEVEKNTARYTSSKGSRPNIEHSASMINMDDPDHQRQRMMVARQFTPRAVRALEERILQVVTALIDAVCEKGWCDVVHDLAAPLPATLIAERLGFSEDQWPRAVYWSETTMQGGGGPRFHTRASEVAVADFAAAIFPIIHQRRAEPRDDLISVWCHKDLDGRPMTDEEIIQEALLLLDGGAETTRTLIGRTVQALIERPDERQKLIDDPAIIGATAVEEFLRWVSPVLNMRRTATEDHELHGHHIKAGDQLLLMYPSANRDEDVYDDPERLDVTREHNNHVAFGFGTHFCLGASLARLEIRIMFEQLMARLPDMRLAAFADPQLQPAAFATGLKDLKVEFTPSAPVGR